jgi:hypothetical protein
VEGQGVDRLKASTSAALRWILASAPANMVQSAINNIRILFIACVKFVTHYHSEL